MVETEQNKYLFIFEKAPAPYLVLTADGCIIDINTAGSELLGENKLYLLYTPFLNFVRRESKENFRAFLQSLAAGQIGHAETEVQIITFSGKNLDIRLQGSAAEEKGVPVLFMTISDVTQYKKAKRKLESQVQEKETIIREMNHRIKNNLNMITSAINLQKIDDGNEKVRAALSDIEARINAVQLIHERIFPSPSTGLIDVCGYLEGLLKAVFTMYDARDIDLTMDIEKLQFSMKRLVLLGLIVSELITNALKYGFAGSEKKELGVGLKQESGGYVLRVRNSGEPIPEHIEVDTADSLGFSLIRTLVDQLEGKAEINRDNSTEFAITFPGP